MTPRSTARRSPFRPMVVLSAVIHVVLAAALVWGPSWISPRRIVPMYQVQLVSLPVEAVPRPKPEPRLARPEAPPPLVKPKPKATPKTVQKPAPPPVEESKPSVKPAPSEIPEAADESPRPEVPEPTPPAPVAKVPEPSEPDIQLVTPLMEAVALKYPFYTRALWRKINENWAPPGAGFADAPREVLVVFTILRDGSASLPTIEQSSGDVFYDQAALRAVMRATPFPPLPPGYPDERMKIYFSFSLDPRQMS